MTRVREKGREKERKREMKMCRYRKRANEIERGGNRIGER